MKKLFIVLFGFIALAQYVQAQAEDGRMVVGDKEQSAVVGKFNYTTDVVEDVIIADMKEKGFKRYNTKSGFKIYEGILFPQISNFTIDFYISIEEYKKDKNVTALAFLVSRGYDNFISRSLDTVVFRNAKTYMNSLSPKFEARKLELDIEAQQKVYNKAKKDYENTLSDGESLAKKKTEIEGDIEKNKLEKEANANDLKASEKLIDEAVSIAKKKAKVEENIIKNKKEQDEQKLIMEKELVKLEALQNQKK